MLSKLILRFKTPVIRMTPTTKILKLPEITVRTTQKLPTVHNYIVFKHYTGNEILYTLKDCAKLRPGEISSGVLELGLRKGLPDSFDWASHPVLKNVILLIKEKCPQYTCRVLTSLAHGFDRLRVKDQELWQLLAQHILRTITTIEPTGLAYCFKAFAGKGFTDLYVNFIEILPVHLSLMTPNDFTNIIQGISAEGIHDEELYKASLDLFITKNLRLFHVSQVNEYIKVCEFRRETCKELIQFLENWTENKLKKSKKVSFGAGSSGSNVKSNNSIA